MINIIGHKFIFLTISALLVIAAVISIGYFGLKQGIDFTGGTAWQIRLQAQTSDAATLLKEKLDGADITVIEESSTNSLIVRMPELDEKQHQELLEALTKKFGPVEELSYETIGPAIGSELRRKAIWAFIAVLVTISSYIALAFRKVSRPVNSWKYGLIALLTLFHDAIIPLGVMAYLGAAQGVEINTNLVVALLVIIGFSVHDTIVVFDRIRENLRHADLSKVTFDNLVNKSVNETLARSINTSLTLIIVLLALYFFASASLTYFVLAILIGVTVGTYSSICVASPLLTLWRPRGNINY